MDQWSSALLGLETQLEKRSAEVAALSRAMVFMYAVGTGRELGLTWGTERAARLERHSLGIGRGVVNVAGGLSGL